MSKLYAIRDVLAGSIVGPIQSMKHDAVAVRFFQDVASQPGTSINQHVEQHELLCIGILDDETGYFTAVDWPESEGLGDCKPQVVITGAALVAMREAQENRK